MVREPAVAGTFYPGDRRSLQDEMARLIPSGGQRIPALGLISPHAGYVYSGGCAGKGYGRIDVPDAVIVLGVNHRGTGHPFAVDGHDAWRTPLGECLVDSGLREQLTAASRIFAVDGTAGRSEHSVEVQVPFIQAVNPQAKILPITLSSMDFEDLILGGKEIAQLMEKRGGGVLMVASTDMSHYVGAQTAERMDRPAIDKILDLDPLGLYEAVVGGHISMCGVSPTVMMLAAAVEAGASDAELIEYTHSGKVSGDVHQVVAYLSAVVF